MRCRRRSITGWRPEGFPLSRQREGARARNQPMGTRSLTRQLPPSLPAFVDRRVAPPADSVARVTCCSNRTPSQRRLSSNPVPVCERAARRSIGGQGCLDFGRPPQAVPKLDPSTERTQKPTREPLGPTKQYRINLCVVVVVPYDTHALAGSPTRTAEKGEKKPTVFSEKNSHNRVR